MKSLLYSRWITGAAVRLPHLSLRPRLPGSPAPTDPPPPPPPPPVRRPPAPPPTPAPAAAPRPSRRAAALAHCRSRRRPPAASVVVAAKGPALGTPRWRARHAITAVTAAPLHGPIGAIGPERRRAPARPRRAVTHPDRVAGAHAHPPLGRRARKQDSLRDPHARPDGRDRAPVLERQPAQQVAQQAAPHAVACTVAVAGVAVAVVAAPHPRNAGPL